MSPRTGDGNMDVLADAPSSHLETRIDAPHLVVKPGGETGAICRAGTAKAAQVAEAATPQPAAVSPPAEQLRRQADQLAAYLRARQRELDQREAEINSKMAQLESASRAARLSSASQREAMEERAAELTEQEQEFNRRLERLAAAETGAQRRQAAIEQELACREEAVRQAEKQVAACRHAEDELRWQRQQIDTRREASLELVRLLLAQVARRREAVEDEARRQTEKDDQRNQSLLQRERKCEELAETLEARLRRIEQSEALCRRTALEQQQALAELERKREALRRQNDEASRQHAALEQMRTDLEQVHRDTLEIRLATQDLWLRLTGAVEPEELMRSLAPLRARLAEHYRAAQDDLEKRKQELEALRRQLAQQYEKLVRYKQAVDAWAQQRVAAAGSS